MAASRLPDVDLGGARAESIAAGGYQTCVVLTDGKVRCWGSNSRGEVGLNSLEVYGDNESPNNASFNVDFGTDLRAVQVAAGWLHTCALFSNGRVRCWGLGNAGQLGNGGTDNWGDSAQRIVANQKDVQLDGRAVQVVAGEAHSCALLESGDVQCWGDGQYGQLGLGNKVDIGDNETALETVFLGGSTKAEQIAAGDRHTCALLDTGSVRCWGANHYGQLGLGTRDELSVANAPSSPSFDVRLGTGGDILEITAGGSHSCVIYGDGQLRCWGFGGYGVLGVGSSDPVGAEDTPDSPSYNTIIGDGLAVTRIEMDDNHTCAVLDSGAVRCCGKGLNCGYGSDSEGALFDIGNGTGPFPTPASAGNVPLF